MDRLRPIFKKESKIEGSICFMKRLLSAILLIGLLVAGCGGAKPDASGQAQAEAKPGAMVTLSVADLKKRIDAGPMPVLIDVREQSEWNEGHIDGAKLMPLATVEKMVADAGLAKDQEIVLICRSGNRSGQAYQKLQALGYTNLKNVTGGMNEWTKIGPVTK